MNEDYMEMFASMAKDRARFRRFVEVVFDGDQLELRCRECKTAMHYSPGYNPSEAFNEIDQHIRKAHEMRTCPWCNGSGNRTAPSDPGDAFGKLCSRCEGTGKDTKTKKEAD